MIVVDTNVLIAGLLTGNRSATTAQILDAMVSGRVRPVVSPALLDEYRAVLLRPKIAARHALSVHEIDRLLTAVVQNAIWRVSDGPTHSAPDPGDNHLWAILEFEPNAKLITGDQHLIGAPPFEARSVSVQDFEWMTAKC